MDLEASLMMDVANMFRQQGKLALLHAEKLDEIADHLEDMEKADLVMDDIDSTNIHLLKTVEQKAVFEALKQLAEACQEAMIEATIVSRAILNSRKKLIHRAKLRSVANDEHNIDFESSTSIQHFQSHKKAVRHKDRNFLQDRPKRHPYRTLDTSSKPISAKFKIRERDFVSSSDDEASLTQVKMIKEYQSDMPTEEGHDDSKHKRLKVRERDLDSSSDESQAILPSIKILDRDLDSSSDDA